MPDRIALDVVRRYHAGWTSKRFEEANDLLAPGLVVEVPINEYPNRESFVQALRVFGRLVTRVDIVAELGDGDQAMLLYDLEAEQLGALRVAEHFTVDSGRIVRLRQIHDTAPVRAWLERGVGAAW